MEFLAPRFDHMGTILVEESSMAVWIPGFSQTLSTPTHCVGSNAHQCPVTWAGFGW